MIIIITLLLQDLDQMFLLNLPINAQHGNNSHRGKLVADVHHHNRFAHKVSKDPLPVSDQLVNVERHHKQEQHVGYSQVQHIDVRNKFLLAPLHRVDHQSVGYNSHKAQDAINGWENVHESGDIDITVSWGCWGQTRRAGEVVGLVGFAKYDGVVHLQILSLIVSAWLKYVRSGRCPAGVCA